MKKTVLVSVPYTACAEFEVDFILTEGHSDAELIEKAKQILAVNANVYDDEGELAVSFNNEEQGDLRFNGTYLKRFDSSSFLSAEGEILK